MIPRRAMAALVGAQLLAAVAMAQSNAPTAATSEFGSTSGGQIELLTKGTRTTSGSIGMSTSANSYGYEATLGGTLLHDRLWFFGTASILPGMPQRAQAGTVDLKMGAQLGPRNRLAAAFSEGRDLETAIPDTAAGSAPASFLSLRYTGIVSSNLFFNATIMRRSATQ